MRPRHADIGGNPRWDDERPGARPLDGGLPCECAQRGRRPSGGGLGRAALLLGQQRRPGDRRDERHVPGQRHRERIPAGSALRQVRSASLGTMIAVRNNARIGIGRSGLSDSRRGHRRQRGSLHCFGSGAFFGALSDCSGAACWCLARPIGAGVRLLGSLPVARDVLPAQGRPGRWP